MPTSQESSRSFKWSWFFKTAATITLVLTCGYLFVMSPLDELLYDRIILQPAKYPVGFPRDATLEGVKPQDIFFKAPDGMKLHGWFFKAQHERGVALFSHGSGGQIAQPLYRPLIVEMFLQVGVSVFIYDYEGYGRSEGNPSFPHIFADATAAYACVSDEMHYSPERIILFGESLGTLANADLSQHAKCVGIIEQCPLYSMQRRGIELIPALRLYPDWAWASYGRSTGSIFSAPHVPLLVIAGSKDDRVPVDEADSMFAQACEPKRYIRIDGAGHSDNVLLKSSQYREGFVRFLDERLGKRI